MLSDGSDGSDGAREARPALPGNNSIQGSILPLPSSTLADVQHASARRRLEGRAIPEDRQMYAMLSRFATSDDQA